MGLLVAQHDWASTPLGPLSAWPQSLKTATAMILNSPLPMVMLIGREGVAIYNDAYARLVDKKPQNLGARARECWPEIATVSDQAIEAALHGDSLSFRDLALTVHRNGRLEHIWLNIDCSPVTDEGGHPFGALCITVETTERVVAERRAKQDLARLRETFEQAPGFICLMLGPDLIVDYTNEAHRRLFGNRLAKGRPYGETFADLADDAGFAALRQVYATGERYVGRAHRVRSPRPDGRELFLDLVIEPMRDHGGAITGLYVEGFDVTAQVRAQQAAAESERRLSAAVAIARLGAFEWDLGSDTATLDARAREIFGFGPDERLLVSDVVKRINPTDLSEIAEQSREAQAEGQTRGEYEYRIRLPDGSIRNIVSVSDVMRGPSGQGRRIIGVFDDVTERRRAEKRQRLLINELNHRVKNTLATVQSIAAQTLHSAPDLASAREAFEARLIALAGAHDLLTAESWHGARLSDVVASTMAPFETTRQPQISRSGPPVWLSAQRALALSMALHELATNAVKYGALSGLEGHVTIHWTRSADNQITLSWVEQGGPPVTAPKRSGFGTRLLQRSLAHELDGEVAFSFAPEGVRCTIRFRLGARSATAPSAMLHGLDPSGTDGT
jgi:PAS domain S-box-containing protein